MNALMNILLVLLYPVMLLARVLNAVLGRDPLRLRQPKGESFWVARELEPDRNSFFSEASLAEGRNNGGMGHIAARLLTRIAHIYAPPRTAPGEKYSVSADREQGIPDEVYTLW
jgi:hypothetical protein